MYFKFHMQSIDLLDLLLSGITVMLFFSLQLVLHLFDCWTPICAYVLPYKLLDFFFFACGHTE